MISAPFKAALEESLSEKLKSVVQIKDFNTIGGGCINQSYRLQTTAGDFFLKWNHASKYPDMFEAEAKGLSLLREAHALKIPEVILYGEDDGKSFLVLEYIASGKVQNNFWEDFGISLAKLHQAPPSPHVLASPSFGGVGEASFGLDLDNYIGSLPQSNRQHYAWIDFFIHERLEKQIAIAKQSGAINTSIIQHFNNLYKRLPELIPDEKPSLLHGNLWNGNYLVPGEGASCLIDPAVYYGHREMDLAMTRLFGGFSEEFYEGYNEAFPLTPGFEERVDIHNLYPLMVHVNLFGGSYVSQVKTIISRF